MTDTSTLVPSSSCAVRGRVPSPHSALRRLRPLAALVSLGAFLLGCGSDTADTPVRAAGGASGAGGGKGPAQAGRGGASGGGAGTGGAGAAGAAGASGKAGSSGSGGAAAGASGKAGSSGSGGQGKAGAGGVPIGGGCASDTDCPALATIPPSCAAATCDQKTKKCVYASKDADGDKFAAGRCAPLDGITPIVIGEDCDDTNPDVSPKGWDGPAGDGKPNHCGDGLDQNCSGIDDDQKLADGTTCTCGPGDTRDCSLDASGKPVVFPGGKPKGICAFGHQTCVDSGKWGPCVDTVAPNVEVCDPASKVDEDCDGLVDDADPDVLGKKTWFCDADSDGFLAPNVVAVPSCQQPPKEKCAGLWVTTGQKTDCDDGPEGGGTFPGAKEVCDGVRNDCDPSKKADEGAIAIATWLRDDDGDGHLLSASIGSALKKVQCARPGQTAVDCPAGKSTCTELWLREGQGTADDCDDANANRYPGNWDGPATTQAGIDDAGFLLDYFQRSVGNYTYAGGFWTTPFLGASDVAVSSQSGVPAVSFNWGNGRPTPKMGYDWFQMRATGALVVEEPGDYTFNLSNLDDGGRLWVGDKGAPPIIDQWRSSPSQSGLTATIKLTPGTYPLTLEFMESLGSASVQLDWSGPSFTRTVLRVKDPAAIGSKPDRCGGGLDQDCNGNPDDGKSLASGSVRSCSMICEPGSVRPCAAAEAVQNNVGECRVGRQVCAVDGAAWGACADQVEPVTELCDGKDNNCNGGVDEGDPGGNLVGCSSGVPGVCAIGVSHCRNGTLQCDERPSVRIAEACDGLDNNCDGAVDNRPAGQRLPGEGVKCFASGQVGICACGERQCASGALGCVPTIAAYSYDFQFSPVTCPGVFSASGWDWNCNGVEEPSVSLTSWVPADPTTFCATRSSEAACKSGDPVGDGDYQFYLTRSGGGALAPYPGCGESYQRQNCWWGPASKRCNIGNSGGVTTVACK